jgi:hypothetical protein
MGADIHMYVEYRVGGSNSEWIMDENHKPAHSSIKDDTMSFAPLNTPRHYGIFSALACVRGGGGLLPKGMPPDISDGVKEALNLWGADAHSHSFLSMKEFENVIVKKCSKFTSPTNSSDVFSNPHEHSTTGAAYVAIVNYCKKLKENKAIDGILLDNKHLKKVDVRLVFWFDS